MTQYIGNLGVNHKVLFDKFIDLEKIFQCLTKHFFCKVCGWKIVRLLRSLVGFLMEFLIQI